MITGGGRLEFLGDVLADLRKQPRLARAEMPRPLPPPRPVRPVRMAGAGGIGEDLFADLVASAPPRKRAWKSYNVSLVVHSVAIAALVLVPILWPYEPPLQPDYIRALIYNPPPPPPAPLPKGSALIDRKTDPRPVTPEKKPEKPTLTAQVEVPKEQPLKPEARDPETEQAGSERGSDLGVAEGMEEGVEGGVVGGTPGGVLGGVIGGTGDGPVLDYDQPPRALKQVKPVYPQDAFVKKIEGVVVVEILIGADGRVKSARVLQSIPVLDKAAVEAAYQWVFSAAIKHGRPVPTVAHLPITFRIY